MKNLNPEKIEKAKTAQEHIETQELNDDMLDGVSGGFGLTVNTTTTTAGFDEMDGAAKGLVQLINPSSSRL